MVIGIDISQLAYENTGVANYLAKLVGNLIRQDSSDRYILFFSSLRRSFRFSILDFKSIPKNVTIRQFKLPPTVLDLLWNRLHILPVENFIGDIDVFITSDWTEPPVKNAKKATILYDLLVYKYPEEMHNKTEFNPLKLLIKPNIVSAQKRKLAWVKKESSKIFCISESTKKDAMEILGIDKNKLEVVHPGL